MNNWQGRPGGDWDLSALIRQFVGDGFGDPGARRGGFGGGPGGHRGPFGGFGGPPPWAGGFGGHRSSRQRATRGNVRSAVLALLGEQPMHGYQIIQEIGRRSGGSWKPSPGSVYPTLQQLEDEGLVRAEEQDGKRIYHLTPDGEQTIADRGEEFADLWETVAPNSEQRDSARGLHEMGELAFGVAAAFAHVMRTGTAEQHEQARRLLSKVKADLYRILGDDEGFDNSDDDAGAADRRSDPFTKGSNGSDGSSAGRDDDIDDDGTDER